MGSIADDKSTCGLDHPGRLQDPLVAKTPCLEKTRPRPRRSERLTGRDRNLAIVAIVHDQKRSAEPGRDRQQADLLDGATSAPLDRFLSALCRIAIEPDRGREHAEPRPLI